MKNDALLYKVVFINIDYITLKIIINKGIIKFINIFSNILK